MHAASSVDTDIATNRPAFDLAPGRRLAIAALGYLPLAHLTASLGAAAAAGFLLGRWAAVPTALGMIYLVPPFGAALARPRALLSRLDRERCPVGSPAFLRWWYITQWQVLFHRFPALEEVLRLIPGCYSAWLRMWGAKIGGFVYWSPGVKLFDRPFLRVGDRVVIGADTKICPHIIARRELRQSDSEEQRNGEQQPGDKQLPDRLDGGGELVLSPITIGDDALVGGSTLLPAGVSIAAGEQTPGGRPMAPFARYCNGRHQRTTRFATDGNRE